nr:alpha-2C adrenergic receptor-like [Aedes albopictus]
MDYPMVATGNISQEDFLAIVGGNSSLAGLGLHGVGATNALNDTLGGVIATGDNRTLFHGYPSGYTLPHIIIASIIVTILMIVIVVGNMLVIIAIATEKALKNIQNWFIASLAVADFFLGLVIMPFSLANELMGYWIFGNWWCDIHSAMDVLLCTSSIMNLCLISLDRYWSITKAIEYLKSRTPGRAAFMIAAVWIMSALVCIPPLLGWKAPRPEEHVELPQCQIAFVRRHALAPAPAATKRPLPTTGGHRKPPPPSSTVVSAARLLIALRQPRQTAAPAAAPVCGCDRAAAKDFPRDHQPSPPPLSTESPRPTVVGVDGHNHPDHHAQR